MNCLKGPLFILLLLCIFFTVQAQEKVWTLKECISQALEKNILLRESILSNEINRINYTQSKANRIPNLNFTDSHSYNSGSSYNAGNGQNINQNILNNTSGHSQYEFINIPTLTSSVTLFNGFHYTNLIKEYKLSYESGNLDIEKMKNDLSINVVAAYVQVLYEYEAVEIALNQVRIDSAQMEYTRKYVQAGKQPESNLLQIQAQLSTDRAAQTDAENQLEIAKVTLMQFMEIPIKPDFDIERPNTENISPDMASGPADIYNIAETIMPEVKSATIKTDATAIGLKISRSEVIPRLTLSGSLSSFYSSADSRISYYTIQQLQNIGYIQGNPSEQVVGYVPVTSSVSNNYPFFDQMRDNFSRSVSLNLTVPIFNNLQYTSDIKRSKIALENAKLNEYAVKNQLRKNVEQAYTDQRAASKDFIATQEQLSFRERSYGDMEKKFHAGIVTITDFLVEQANYNKAILAHAQAKYNYIFKTKIIAFYLSASLTQ